MSDFNTPARKKDKRRIVTALFVLSAAVLTAMWPGITEKYPVAVVGIFILSASAILSLYLFLVYYRREILHVMRKVAFLLASVLLSFALTRLVLEYAGSSYIYAVPLSLVAIIIRMFYGTRIAVFSLIITVLLCGFIVPDPLSFVFISVITCFAAVFSLSDINRKAMVFFSVIVVVICYTALYTAITVSGISGDISIDRNVYFSFVINGFLILLSYPLIFIFEKRFYFLSDTTLLELCDTNQPLLRNLAVSAPGSYHHSLQVAILAEEAARAIGANILLARAGALYHDIGKISNPGHFIENQEGGVSPHEELDPLSSASIIIGHVNAGVKLGKRYNLPVQILDFIRTHHGTTKAYYFYKKYLESGKTAAEAGENFIYPGPRPFTRELAIVMMADAVEASSHTLDKYNDYNISELVERILIIQEQDEQFSEAPLTYRDLTVIRRVFKKGLSNIYHSRIAYPYRDGAEA